MGQKKKKPHRPAWVNDHLRVANPAFKHQMREAGYAGMTLPPAVQALIDMDGAYFVRFPDIWSLVRPVVSGEFAGVGPAPTNRLVIVLRLSPLDATPHGPVRVRLNGDALVRAEALQDDFWTQLLSQTTKLGMPSHEHARLYRLLLLPPAQRVPDADPQSRPLDPPRR